MKYKTYGNWKINDYYVIKGSKSEKRNKEGKCLFSEKQVKHIIMDREPGDFYFGYTMEDVGFDIPCGY
jgi:hypothetical protein